MRSRGTSGARWALWLIAFIILALVGTGMTAQVQIVSGQSGSVAASDLTPLPNAPRWVERASTNVFLRFTGRWRTMRQTARRAAALPPGPGPLATVAGSGRMFNRDLSALPQNETSVAIDPTKINRIVGAYNDYRGLATGGFTGWTVSTDGGVSLGRDGQLPAVTMWGVSVPSEGDPTVDADKDGNFFLGGLHFDDSDGAPNGITIARSPKAGSPTGVFSAACTGGLDPDCWPTIRAVTANLHCSWTEGSFDDKPYIAVDKTTSIASGHVYAVWTRFPCSTNGSQIMIAKCDNMLASCTNPVALDATSGIEPAPIFVQLSHLAVAPDGNVYVTWVRHSRVWNPIDLWTETATIMLRQITPTGSTSGAAVGTLGPLRTVYAEAQPIPWKHAPYPARYRTATYPHVAVDEARVIVVWDRRTTSGIGGASAPWWFDYGTSASVAARYSNDGGASWSSEQTVSSAWGPQYQPSVCVDSTSGKVVVAYYSHQDDRFAHAQDVYVATSDDGAAPYTTLRVTSESNSTEADPTLSDFFIGDYLEVACGGGRAYVHFTANYGAKWFGAVDGALYGRQQDTFLARVTLP